MKMRNFGYNDLRVHLFDYDVSDIVAHMPPADDPIWDLDTRRQIDPVWGLGATRSIIFKWFVDLTFDWKHSPDVTPFVHNFHMDSPLWAATKPLIDQLEEYHNGVAVRAYFSELAPNSEIERHHDGDCLLVPLVPKSMVAVITNDSEVIEFNEFTIDTLDSPVATELPIELGKVYEFDNMRLHTGINRGSTRRVWLIVDILPNDFQECILSGGYGEYPVTTLYATDRTITYTAYPENGRVEVNNRTYIDR